MHVDSGYLQLHHVGVVRVQTGPDITNATGRDVSQCTVPLQTIFGSFGQRYLVTDLNITHDRHGRAGRITSNPYTNGNLTHPDCHR